MGCDTNVSLSLFHDIYSQSILHNSIIVSKITIFIVPKYCKLEALNDCIVRYKALRYADSPIS